MPVMNTNWVEIDVDSEGGGHCGVGTSNVGSLGSGAR